MTKKQKIRLLQRLKDALIDIVAEGHDQYREALNRCSIQLSTLDNSDD